MSQISLVAFKQHTRLEQVPEQTKAENLPLSKAGFLKPQQIAPSFTHLNLPNEGQYGPQASKC